MNFGNSRVLSLIVTTGIICLSLSSISKKTRWNYFLFIVQFILYVLSKVEKTHVKFLPKSNLTSMWLQRVSTMGVVQNWVEFSPDVEILVTSKSNWRWFIWLMREKYILICQFFAKKQCIILILQRMGWAPDQAVPLCKGLVVTLNLLSS